MTQTVAGREVIVHFDGKRCIHSRNCVLRHPEVFVPNVKGEWIRPDAAPADEVIRIGQMCPSGAIRVERVGGGAVAGSNLPPVVNTVHVRENGPLAFEAELLLRGQPHDSVACHALPLRPVEEQALLRQLPCRGRFHRDRRARREGYPAA